MVNKAKGYAIVSADAHVNEPPNLWEERLPSTLRERGPRVVGANGSRTWTWEGKTATAAVGQPSGKADTAKFQHRINRGVPFSTRSRGHFGKVLTEEDTDYDFFATEPSLWLKDMDTDGVDVAVLYPGVGMNTFGILDDELRRACVRAYNEWLADFCKGSNGRLVGIAIAPVDDGPEYAAKEIEHAAGLGLRGALIPTWPGVGSPYTDPAFDRFWEAAQELDMPLSMHRGTGRGGSGDTVGQHPSAGVVFRFFASVQPIGNMVFTGVFDRFPSLNVVSVESNFGWAPFVFEQSDDQDRRQRSWDAWQLKRKPSDYWRENVYYTFLEDHFGIRHRHETGIDKIMWSNDYPHTVGLFPDSLKYIEDTFAGVPEDEKRMMISENAKRLYRL